MMPSVETLTDMARESGFDLVGIGPSDPGVDGHRFLDWIAKRRHGTMAWLERNASRILDPEQLLPGARSALSLAVGYGRSRVELPGGGKLARYAAGRDYHKVLGRRLARLTTMLTKEGVPADSLRSGVDALPFLERSLAWKAGIGFLAKSSGIIHPDRGPWLMLAEILTKSELPQSAPSAGSCGTCTRCLEECPTVAIVAPHQLDSRNCLSYSTIEHRGPIPWDLRSKQGSWLFGCDVCIEVCPFQDRGGVKLEDPDFRLHPLIESYDLVGVLELSSEEYASEWTGTALRRAGRAGLRRNAAIVMGNLGMHSAGPALSAALADPDPGLRSAAAWALARMGLERQAIHRAWEQEPDAEIRQDLGRSLESFGVRGS